MILDNIEKSVYSYVLFVCIHLYTLHPTYNALQYNI